MKKAMLLLLALLIFCCSFSSTPVSTPAHSDNFTSMPPALVKIITTLSPREFEKATGKKLRFKDTSVYRVLQWKLRKKGHDVIDERQRKQGNLSLILGIAAVVFLFIPVLGILSPGLAIAAIVLGIMSLKGNSNTAGIVGIICGGTVIFLFLLAVAVLAGGWL
jgi:hypothetical protein